MQGPELSLSYSEFFLACSMFSTANCLDSSHPRLCLGFTQKSPFFFCGAASLSFGYFNVHFARSKDRAIDCLGANQCHSNISELLLLPTLEAPAVQRYLDLMTPCI